MFSNLSNIFKQGNENEAKESEASAEDAALKGEGGSSSLKAVDGFEQQAKAGYSSFVGKHY